MSFEELTSLFSPSLIPSPEREDPTCGSRETTHQHRIEAKEIARFTWPPASRFRFQYRNRRNQPVAPKLQIQDRVMSTFEIPDEHANGAGTKEVDSHLKELPHPKRLSRLSNHHQDIELIPGTELLDDVDGVYSQDGVLETKQHIILLPEPSSDPHDPLVRVHPFVTEHFPMAPVSKKSRKRRN